MSIPSLGGSKSIILMTPQAEVDAWLACGKLVLLYTQAASKFNKSIFPIYYALCIILHYEKQFLYIVLKLYHPGNRHKRILHGRFPD
jgi:hypothetical protein